MKRLSFLVCLLCWGVIPCFSQIYRVQDYSELTEMPAGKAALRWEISAAAFANTLALQDFTGQAVSDGEIGADLRLLYKASIGLPWGRKERFPRPMAHKTA